MSMHTLILLLLLATPAINIMGTMNGKVMVGYLIKQTKRIGANGMYIIVGSFLRSCWIVYDEQTGRTFGTDNLILAENVKDTLQREYPENHYAIHEITLDFTTTLDQLGE